MNSQYKIINSFLFLYENSSLNTITYIPLTKNSQFPTSDWSLSSFKFSTGVLVWYTVNSYNELKKFWLNK